MEQRGSAEVWSVLLDTAPSSRWGSDPAVLSLHTEQTGGKKSKEIAQREREINQGKLSLLG